MDILNKNLFVKKPTLVKMGEEACKGFCDAIGVEYLKGYENRVVEYVLTDATTDRAGDKILPEGVMWKDFYPENPVIMVSHDLQKLPVGKALKVWYDEKANNVKAYVLFLDERVDNSKVASTIFKYVKSGVLSGGSIGFRSLESIRPKTKKEKDELGLGEYGTLFKKISLHEFSVCAVPCNPNAGISREFINEETKEIEQFSEDEILIYKNLFVKKEESLQIENKEFDNLVKSVSNIHKQLADQSKMLEEMNFKLVDLQNKIDVLMDKPIFTEEEIEEISEDETKQAAFTAEDFNNIFNKIFNEGLK